MNLNMSVNNKSLDSNSLTNEIRRLTRSGLEAKYFEIYDFNNL